jgi:hypothetical protein
MSRHWMDSDTFRLVVAEAAADSRDVIEAVRQHKRVSRR